MHSSKSTMPNSHILAILYNQNRWFDPSGECGLLLLPITCLGGYEPQQPTVRRHLPQQALRRSFPSRPDTCRHISINLVEPQAMHASQDSMQAALLA